jgi:hypothetical protein
MNLILPTWAKWAALALLALALYAFGRLDGARIEGAKHLAYVANQATETVRVAKAQEKVVVKAEIKYRDRIRIVKEKGDVIVQKVPTYITLQTDRNFPLPVGFVRLHDGAAAGNDPGPSSDSDGKASAVTTSAASTIIASNYTECRKLAEQVEGWQAYYEELQQVTNPPTHSQ